MCCGGGSRHSEKEVETADNTATIKTPVERGNQEHFWCNGPFPAGLALKQSFRALPYIESDKGNIFGS